MIVSCHTADCPCHRVLAEVHRFRGRLQIKCPRCRNVHEYGDGAPATQEVRCPNTFKGKDLGGWCGQMAMKISLDTSGEIIYTCARCGLRRTVRIDTPAMALST